MSQPSSASTTYVAYYSAHRGPVWRSDGGFHHFARQCDPIHTKNGYWRFCTYQDDRRAYERGLSTPEAVLIAQDVGDGTYDDILLRWVSGELDTGNKPTVGTAAAHLETIYSERRLLGKSLSFRGRVPLYPVSTDQRLINYRLVRYGIQRGVFSETVFTSPSSQLSPSESVPLIPAQNHLHEASLLGIRLRGQVPSNFIDASNDTFAFLKTPAIESCGLEERYSAYDSQGVCYIPGSDEIANKLVGGISIPSRTALTPSELYDAQSAILPCIDCGIVGTHMSDCRIAEATLILSSFEELTSSNIGELAERVARFDPGPWTTHVGTPKEVVLDYPCTQIQGMAEIIRNLDKSAGDPELQACDDLLTVLLWALKSSDDVTIVNT